MPEQAVISVAELGRRLRQAVERMAPVHWVQGEVSSLRHAASGHSYFTLKDETEDAIIDCVMYRLAAQRAHRLLVDGAKIQLAGKATVWAPRGRLQFVGEHVRLAGKGALLAALLQLKEKLAKEGLFERERKRALPQEPRVVGVVTSAHGAVWHDIRVVAARRAPIRLVLAPALVQGDGAVDSLLRALDLIERFPGLDALIIARGGGSFEDLMPFNDERLVRRVARLRVPVVSAVGHETDTTLCDWVADARAATPSQAAELLVPDRSIAQNQLAQLAARLKRGLTLCLRAHQTALTAVRVKLSDPRFVIAEKQQSLDDLALRLERRAQRLQAADRLRLTALSQRLAGAHPRAAMLSARLRLQPLEDRLNNATRARTLLERQRVSMFAARLHALSPLSVLGRGYAIALLPQGRVLSDAAQVQVGDMLKLRLARGTVQTRVEATEVVE